VCNKLASAGQSTKPSLQLKLQLFSLEYSPALFFWIVKQTFIDHTFTVQFKHILKTNAIDYDFDAELTRKCMATAKGEWLDRYFVLPKTKRKTDRITQPGERCYNV